MSFAIVAKADLLEDKKVELNNLQKKIEEQEVALKKVRQQKLTLDNQVNLLDKQIESAHLSLKAIVVEVETIGLERSSINKELVDLEVEALDQKIVLQKAIKSSYLMRRKSLVETLLSSDSLADFMSHLEYLDRVQHHISMGITTLNELKDNLAIKKVVLEDKNERLAEIQSARILEEASLQIQVNAKQGILQDLKFTESDYQERLESARAEQQAISNEIASLLRSTPKKNVPLGELKLAWPVPKGIITATFHDQSYYRRFGITHNAIDIAVPQGTSIKAPASGTVTKIKDGGSGLSYMIVNHDNGLATVYLHLSGFAVSPGAYVAQGQVIGYTGGTPGTPGAGWLTTGPHLHFEVWYDSQARNPLAYLI